MDTKRTACVFSDGLLGLLLCPVFCLALCLPLCLPAPALALEINGDLTGDQIATGGLTTDVDAANLSIIGWTGCKQEKIS